MVGAESKSKNRRRFLMLPLSVFGRNHLYAHVGDTHILELVERICDVSSAITTSVVNMITSAYRLHDSDSFVGDSVCE